MLQWGGSVYSKTGCVLIVLGGLTSGDSHYNSNNIVQKPCISINDLPMIFLPWFDGWIAKHLRNIYKACLAYSMGFL